MLTLREARGALEGLQRLQEVFGSSPDTERVIQKQEAFIASLITDRDNEEKSQQQPELLQEAN